MPRQFADDSMTPEPISVSRDKYQNEIPSDRTNHTDNTAGMGGFNWQGNQYATDFTNYGVSTDANTGAAEKVSVDVSRADRGKES